jgi:uncharacterized membrane protein YkoI
MKLIVRFACSAVLLAGVWAAESKVKLTDLPAAVQNTVKAQTKGAEIVEISREAEKGKTTYEVESTVNGKSRDLTIDSGGNLISIEEETTLDSIPAPAREAILKKVGPTGKIRKVEIVTEGSAVSYEVSYVSKSGKKAEAGVNADGTPHK